MGNCQLQKLSLKYQIASSILLENLMGHSLPKIAFLLATFALLLPHQLSVSAREKVEGENFTNGLWLTPRINLITEKVTNSQLSAKALLDRAVALSQKLERDYLRESALFEVATNYAKIGEFERGIQIAETIQNKSDRARSISEIAQAYAKAQQRDRGLKLAQTIGDNDAKIAALAQIARYYQQAGQIRPGSEVFQQSRDLANQLKSSYGLVQIATAYSQVGEYDKAIGIVSIIEDKSAQVEALVAIAGELFQGNQPEKSTKILAQGLSIATEIDDHWLRSRALTGIAQQYYQSKQTNRGAEVLVQALNASEQIDEYYTRNLKFESWLEIADNYAKSGQKKQAIALIEKATKLNENEEFLLVQSGGLGKIASNYAAIGEYDRALELVKAIRNLELVGWQSGPTAKIAAQYAAAGEFKQALNLANSIPDKWRNTYALVDIANHYIKAENPEQAWQVLQKAENNRYKISALINLIDSYIESDPNSPVPLLLLPQAMQAAEAVKSDSTRFYHINQIAVQYGAIGQKDRAIEIVGNSLEKASEIKDPDLKAAVLQTAIEVYASVQEYDRALELANSLPEIAGYNYKDSALSTIVLYYAKAGDYDRALSLRETIQDPNDKIGALTSIVQAYIKIGDKEKAVNLLERGFAEIKTLSNAEQKERGLSNLTRSLAAAGKYDRALQIVENMSNSDDQRYLLKEISIELAKAKQYDRALELTRSINLNNERDQAWREIATEAAKAEDFEQGFQIVDSIQSTTQKAYALTAIAGELIKAGQKDRGLEILAKAEQLNQTVRRTDFTNRTLGEIALEYAKAGKMDLAISLANSIDDSWSKVKAWAAISSYLVGSS